MNPKAFAAAVKAITIASTVTLPVIAQAQGRSGPDHADRHRGADRMQALMELYDSNDDGNVTQDEIDMARAERLAAFDTDADGQLTLVEYEALWLDAMRERMVDQFQRHDDDGDGLVTPEEFGEDFANIVDRRDRNGDGVLNAEDRGMQREASAAPEAE